MKLAKRVNELLTQDDVDGIVITHGTDSIEETACFLNLVVKSRKPVVIVGAMRPSTAISADGPVNLYNAVTLAGSEEAVGKGVLVVLNDQVNGARDVTKTNTANADTFLSGELGFLGYMQDNKPHFYRLSTRKHTTDTEFDVSKLESLSQVDIVYGYANMNRIPIDAFVAAGDKGIVHAGVGDGSLARPAVEPALIEARKKGVIIVRSSRVGNGIVARNGEAKDDDLDFVLRHAQSAEGAHLADARAHQDDRYQGDSTHALHVLLGIRPDGHCPLGLNRQPRRKRSPLCESWVSAIDPNQPVSLLQCRRSNESDYSATARSNVCRSTRKPFR